MRLFKNTFFAKQGGSVLKLHRCWSCDYAFKWTELFFFTRRKQCPICNKIQHITKESDWKRGTMGVPLTLVPPILNILNIPWLWIGVITFILLLYPINCDLQMRKNHYFKLRLFY